MLSIIIPTLNEGKYLPKLLESIKKQTFKDYEIIISDGNSSDSTIKTAKKFGCRVIKDDRKGPGVGRNIGVKIAKGQYLLFLDADVILEKDFLLKNLNEFKERKLGVASCYIRPVEHKLFYKFISYLANIWIGLAQYVTPIAPGYAIFSKKEFHDKVKGFSNEPIFSEDADYAKKISKIAKFRMLKSKYVTTSMRRFEKYGKLRTLYQYLIADILGIFRPVKYKTFNFEFGRF